MMMKSMNLRYATSMMFIGSFIIQYFIMSSIMVYKFDDIKFSLGKIYMSLIMASLMVLLEVFMHDIYMNHFSYNYYIVFTLFLFLIIYLYKNQIKINEREYLKEMIEHHSMALVTSSKILEKTKNQDVKKLAENIIKSQSQEINLMNQLIKKL